MSFSSSKSSSFFSFIWLNSLYWNFKKSTFWRTSLSCCFKLSIFSFIIWYSLYFSLYFIYTGCIFSRLKESTKFRWFFSTNRTWLSCCSWISNKWAATFFNVDRLTIVPFILQTLFPLLYMSRRITITSSSKSKSNSLKISLTSLLLGKSNTPSTLALSSPYRI